MKHDGRLRRLEARVRPEDPVQHETYVDAEGHRWHRWTVPGTNTVLELPCNARGPGGTCELLEDEEV